MGMREAWRRMPAGVRSALASALVVLKYVLPLYLLSDVLLYFDLLRPLGVFFSPFTKLLDLPPEAASALVSGMLLNIYAGIAFAAPLHLSPYQWTILGVFLGVCHSLLVESAIMARLGLAYGYSVILRLGAAILAVSPVLLLGPSFYAGEAAPAQGAALTPVYATFLEMLFASASRAAMLAGKIILLMLGLMLFMDWLKSTALMQRRLKGANTSFSILVGQLLGIIYGAGILLREAQRGVLSREDIFFIGTFLMICHSLIEDILLFVLFGAEYWSILILRLVTAFILSWALGRLFRANSLDWVMRR